jgi:hypothetical protein
VHRCYRGQHLGVGIDTPFRAGMDGRDRRGSAGCEQGGDRQEAARAWSVGVLEGVARQASVDDGRRAAAGREPAMAWPSRSPSFRTAPRRARLLDRTDSMQ